MPRVRIANRAGRLRAMAVIALTAVTSCSKPQSSSNSESSGTLVAINPGSRLERRGDEIVVCGQLYHTTAPVVLWTDPGGYDAYRTTCRFSDCELPVRGGDNAKPNRYDSIRGDLPPDIEDQVRTSGWTVETLSRHVDLFLIHYDVCSSSRQCFKILHDVRGLSVHFMLDLDGTIYQTLDVKERARQTGQANERSIGIEIANIGAYPNMETLEKWYASDSTGRMRVTLPGWLGDGGLRTPDFVARPARNEPVHGTIQGHDLMQYDFTDQQYESLTKLAATLCRVLPGIKPDAPRDAGGAIRDSVLSDEEFADFSGLMGHYHVTEQKIDPGPAFDWQRVIRGVKRTLNQPQ